MSSGTPNTSLRPRMGRYISYGSVLVQSVKSPGNSFASRSLCTLQLVPSSCSTRKYVASRERATCDRVCRMWLGSERTSATRSAPICVRVRLAANVSRSMGSETTGVKVLHAISFQNSSLLPGSRPSVANVSNMLVVTLLDMSVGPHAYHCTPAPGTPTAHGARRTSHRAARPDRCCDNCSCARWIT